MLSPAHDFLVLLCLLDAVGGNQYCSLFGPPFDSVFESTTVYIKLFHVLAS